MSLDSQPWRTGQLAKVIHVLLAREITG